MTIRSFVHRAMVALCLAERCGGKLLFQVGPLIIPTAHLSRNTSLILRMDNLFVGIFSSQIKRRQTSGMSSRADTLPRTPQSRPPGWQLCSGISGRLHLEYAHCAA